MTNPIHKLLVVAWVILQSCTTPTMEAEGPQLFNMGRTRCFGGGLAFTSDGKTLFHPVTVKTDSAQFPYIRLAKSTWSDSGWSEPYILDLTTSLDVFPVLSEDEKRIYFTSTAPAPGKTEEGDLNIWYTEEKENVRSKPIFVDSLNTDNNERMVSLDDEGNFYLASDKGGNLDLYTVRLEGNVWTKPEPVANWNTEANEEFVSVNMKLGIAVLQRTQPGTSTEMMISAKTEAGWSAPVPLIYDFKSTTLPYVQRWATLSPDGSTFYFVSHAMIWQQSVKQLLRDNNIDLANKPVPEFKPLAVAPRTPGEPELVGGLQLKTNNGISFTADEKKVYLSRYTDQRDSTGNLLIKIFESTYDSGRWSTPTMLSVCKPDVPFEYHPVLSVDGTRLFFNSRAPAPGASVKYLPKNNLWYSDKQADGSWGEPVLIDVLVTDDHDDYASPTRSGDLYFRSDRPGGKGGGDIYVSRIIDGVYQKPENVKDLNSADNENDVCVDPDERFIIFNRYFDATREIRFYLSMNTGSGWTAPRLLSQLEKDVDWELTPSLSPDGKYFYYEVNSNIMRVETETLFSPDERVYLDRAN